MRTLLFGVNSQQVFLTEKSLSERIRIASLNTVLGLLIVFTVLIVIIILISCFKIIPYLQGRKRVDNVDSLNSVDQVINQISMNEERESTDDYELVAVITAAIRASMSDEVPEGSFIVRSIRKINYGTK